MLVLAVFSILVTATSAATRCCMDRQYEAVYGEIGGAVYAQNGNPQHSLLNGQNVIHTDMYTKKMAMENTLFWPNGTNTTTNMVFDFNTDLMYVKVNGQCYKMPDTDLTKSYMTTECIPAHAVHVRSSYLGYGANQIPFTTWAMFDPVTGVVVRLSVTDVGCIPLAQSMFGTMNKGSTDLIFIITGFRPGLQKPSLLDIPINCTPVPANDLPHHARRAVEKAKKLVTFT